MTATQGDRRAGGRPRDVHAAATGLALCLTIIGIPLGGANFKLALLALVPFGKTVVSLDRVAGRVVFLRGPDPIG